MRFISLVSLLLLLLAAPSAQALFPMNAIPHEGYRTLETEHFRIHYPVEYEEWTLEIAAKMESIRERVVEFVGYPGTDRPLTVLVMDPLSRPNGMAVPSLRYPVTTLWASAPDSPLLIAGQADWAELVFTHEYGHVVHLSRPPRNWKDRLSAGLMHFGPVSLKAPSWASEGLAVILESELTGSGRAQSSIRAAFSPVSNSSICGAV